MSSRHVAQQTRMHVRQVWSRVEEEHTQSWNCQTTVDQTGANNALNAFLLLFDVE